MVRPAARKELEGLQDRLWDELNVVRRLRTFGVTDAMNGLRLGCLLYSLQSAINDLNTILNPPRAGKARTTNKKKGA